jgi:carboxypeptidase Q
MKKSLLLAASLLLASFHSQAQDTTTLRRISDQILLAGSCYEDLRVLCKQIGHRISGSERAARAVEWGQKTLEAAGAERVWLQPVWVPRWVRGEESLKLKFGNRFTEVPMLSLGNTIGTNGKLLEAPVVMVNNFDELRALNNSQVRGHIVFFNYRFRQELPNPFNGYGDAGAYRWNGPNMASARGAVGVIIRSVSTGKDDAPHTGSLRYADSITPIPAVAIGNATADRLEAALRTGSVSAQLRSECRMADSVMSYNVIGEIRGTDQPDQIVLVGGHLDSWDIGEGAHDDGAGCVQSIEVIRTFKALGIRPRRTVRAVLFMNEENGLRGGLAYADSALVQRERHIFALESDAGGFSPRGFSLRMTGQQKKKVQFYAPLFLPYGVYDFSTEGGGADIGPLGRQGVALAGLLPDPQRYFDLHHTALDVFEQISHRELKMGAVAMTGLIYLISEHGL